MSHDFLAWDGTEESFWEVIAKLIKGEDTEGDHALLADVIFCAYTFVEDERERRESST